MKQHLVWIASASILAALFAAPAKAQTYSDACNASSYVVLPGGQCMDLEYLEILGDSRATRQQVEGIYQRQFNANVQIESIYNQFPELNDETEEERDQRYQDLADTSVVRDAAVSSNEEVERMLFPLHVRAMATMREAFDPSNYSGR